MTEVTRMRRLLFIQTASDTARSTPIYMRKSVLESESLPRKQEHPHLRGEYHAWYDVNDDVPGAPPPAWGTQQDHFIPHVNNRLTPTRGGNTLKNP